MKYIVSLTLLLGIIILLANILPESYYQNFFIALGGYQFGALWAKLTDKLWTKFNIY